MTDAFTQIVAREVANLIVQSGRQINGLSLDNSTDGFQLTPEQVLEVMQGNGLWLTQFENELEQSFRHTADKALDYWLRNTDKEIRESLTALSQLVDILTEETEGNLTTQSRNNSQNTLSSSLSRITRKATKELFESLFNRDKTTRNETERSQDSSNRYKASRGQTQARLSKELGRGKRYT
ncbi:MAG: hypothetical protein P8P30_01065 [Rickettsiales bacterium]|nr:hypothetical protein [Rickettsiales bacterium]